MSDSVVLKDVLRQYDGQETHTVHLVFTPKHNSKKIYESQKPVRSEPPIVMNSEGLRQRSGTSVRPTSSTQQNADSQTQQQQPQQQQQQQQQNAAQPSSSTNQYIPNNFLNYNQLYASTSGPSQEYILAQQYAMQSWMQQAYSQYLNQYMNV